MERRDDVGVVTRKDSPYYWLNLERPGKRPIRMSTGILVDASSPAQRKENRRLAQAAYETQMGDLARKRFKLPRTAPARTFRQQATWYLEHHTVKHRGADREAVRIAGLIAAFGDEPLEDITPTRWTEHETQRLKRDKVTINTVGNELTVMKAILKSAVPDWIEASPLAAVQRVKEQLPAKRTISRREETAFVKALAAEDPELRDMYLVGVGTLLRQEALLELRRSHHRGTHLALMVKSGRNRQKPHTIPLTQPTPLQRRAAEVLKRRMPKSHQGYFFPTWHAHFAQHEDRAHARVQFLRIVRRAAAAADIPWGIRNDGVVWHTATRATGATRMLREYKIDVRTVQLIGGWSSLDQMMEYLGIDPATFSYR